MVGGGGGGGGVRPHYTFPEINFTVTCDKVYACSQLPCWCVLIYVYINLVFPYNLVVIYLVFCCWLVFFFLQRKMFKISYFFAIGSSSRDHLHTRLFI